MKTIEVKFEAGQRVWLMYDNKPTEAPITEIHIRKGNKIEFYFWHQDFPSKDKSICYSNTFKVSPDLLFETKADLLNSL